jgi:hypothetical protein
MATEVAVLIYTKQVRTSETKRIQRTNSMRTGLAILVQVGLNENSTKTQKLEILDLANHYSS